MESNPEGLKHRELTEKIIGVFYDVYNELGHGFLESIYEQALAIALVQAGMNGRTAGCRAGMVSGSADRRFSRRYAGRWESAA